MIDAARRADKVLAAGYQYPIQAKWAIDRMASGNSGLPYMLEAFWLRSASQSERGIPNRPGFWDNPEGRGVGPDLISHLLSVGLQMLGSPPVAVNGAAWNHFGRHVIGEAFRVPDDTATIVVDCENGARGTFTGAWGAHLHSDERWFRCLSTEESIKAPLMAGELDSENFRAEITTWDGEQTYGPAPTDTEECFVVQERNWVRACRARDEGGREEEPFLSDPQIAVLVHQVMDAAYESMRNNRRQISLR
jgi:predicted dehydrogenase